jgi:NDP-mannose synthase
MMQAVILAGGLGTRLRPFTITVPKPLLPLGDRPIVDVVLSQLSADGFTLVSMCLGYMAPVFQACLGDGSRFGIKIDYVVEDEPLGTAGALYTVQNLHDDFLVLNGDTLTDLSFRRFLEAHQVAKVCATIFSAKVDEFIDYGVVEFDKNTQHLTQYMEKPTRHYHVSTGIYALSKRILQYADFNSNGRLDMPDLIRAASNQGCPVLCYVEDKIYWRDIGRFDHYEAASKDFEEAPERFLRQAEPAR